MNNWQADLTFKTGLSSWRALAVRTCNTKDGVLVAWLLCLVFLQ